MKAASIVYICMSIITSESARILCFMPLPCPSHHFVYRGVMEQLARKGHTILYVTAFPYDNPPKGIEQMDLSMYLFDEDFHPVQFGEYNILEIVRNMYMIGVDISSSYLGNPKVQELIHSDQRFDAVMFESYFMQEYLSAFIHKFNAIGIEIMPFGDNAWTNELSGLPDNPAYQLDFKSELTNPMNFWQRLYNSYVTLTTTLACYCYMHHAIKPLMDHYFNYTGWEGRPSIDVLARNRSLILINAHFTLGYPFPAAPHVKAIGGINIKTNKPLPQDLQMFMDESENGVIYMSFGSNVNFSDVYNEHILDSFISVFEKLPQSVLMKFENNYPGTPPKNVKLLKWMPQQDILAHKNCILFITHGGLLSMTEAVYHGVPLVGIPFFGDQMKNLLFVESEGFGRMLRFRNISQEAVSWEINEVLSKPSYKEEILRRSKILRDKRHTPAEEAVYWIEHSLKYPFALTPKSVSLSAVQLHLIDIKLFILLTLLLIVLLLYAFVNYVIRITTKFKPKMKTKLS